MIVVRYADDIVLGFQHKSEAERFQRDLQQRLRKFNLELHTQKNRDKKILGIVTDAPKLSAYQMIRRYDDRWGIEVFFKDTKQLLGLGQYQNVSFEAAVTHLHLVCFAYALLTHIAITGEGAKGKRKSVASLSTADLQNEARRIVWDDLTEYLKQFSSGTQIVKELGRLLVAA